MRRKNIKQRLQEYFFMNPTTKLRVREIERAINAPLPSVIRYCKELEQEGILTIDKIGTTTFYTADKTNKNYLLEKQLYNRKQLTGLIDYLRTTLNNPPIILFGSYAKGEDIETSDIDLYIETTKEIDVKKFEKKLQRTIQIHKHKTLKTIRNPHLANNIINGITLNNQVEVFK